MLASWNGQADAVRALLAAKASATERVDGASAQDLVRAALQGAGAAGRPSLGRAPITAGHAVVSRLLARAAGTAAAAREASCHASKRRPGLGLGPHRRDVMAGLARFSEAAR